MYLRFVLTRNGKGTDTETAFERRIYDSVFERKGHSMQGYMWKHQGGSDGRSEGERMGKSFYEGSQGKK